MELNKRFDKITTLYKNLTRNGLQLKGFNPNSDISER